MAGLDRHVNTIDSEEHARLAFRRDCPRCRVRLAGPPPSRDVVPARAKGALATAVVLASGALPATSATAQDDGGREVVEIEPPPDAGSSGDSGPPISPPAGDGGDDATSDGGGASSTPIEAPAPPESGGGGGEGTQDASGDTGRSDADEPQASSSSGASDSGGESTGAGGADGSGGSSGAGASPGADASVPAPGIAGPVAAGAGDGDRSIREHERADKRDDRRQGGEQDDRPRDPAERSGGERGANKRGSATAEEAPARGERYTIERGDCLWSIARDLLGKDASDAKVAAKVSELWDLNDTEVIRTGDPDLIHPGQELRLR